MKIKYYIEISKKDEPEKWIEITPDEAKPKSKTADKALFKKYGLSNAEYDKKYK